MSCGRPKPVRLRKPRPHTEYDQGCWARFHMGTKAPDDARVRRSHVVSKPLSLCPFVPLSLRPSVPYSSVPFFPTTSRVTPFTDPRDRFRAGQLGMWLFLTALAMLFVGGLLGYLVIWRQTQPWPTQI